MMRRASKAFQFAEDATLGQLREMLGRVLISRDALREETSALSTDFSSLINKLSQGINETVLPRKFALFSDAGLEATFVVSNRRLIELDIGEKKINFDAEANSDPETVARVYAKALRALHLRSGSLRLRPMGRATKVTTQGSTCTARHILEYSSASTLENRLKAFLKASHARSLGWLYHSGDGQTVSHDPDPEVMKRLSDLQHNAISQADGRKNRNRVARACATCSTFAIMADVSVLIGEDGDDRLLAAFPASEIIAAMTAWQQIFSRTNP